MPGVICSNCRRPYPDEGVPYRCPVCSGYYDLPALPDFDPEIVSSHSKEPGIWRFGAAMGFGAPEQPVSLGEGNSPLVWGQAFGKKVAYKLEFLNPTGSFKDRGTAVLVQFLASRGITAAVEDSSGNAGASFAAYAVRAGIKARVFIPDSAAGPKRRQIEAYQAEVVRIMGPRSNAAEAAQKAVLAAVSSTTAYASHAYLPHNLAGYATLAFELVEQLGRAPGTLIAPVGQGGLLLGAARGFESLLRAGLITALPTLVGVQARACAPLWAVYQFGAPGMSWMTEGQTLAEGVRVMRPVRGDALLTWLRANGGMVVAVEEEQILPGVQELAAQGLYVEPTSALVWNALAQVIDAAPEPIVAVLTGSGLKV